MEKNINQITIADLPGDSYIVRIPQSVLDEGHTYLRGLMENIEHAFPRKEFVWVPAEVEFEENEQS